MRKFAHIVNPVAVEKSSHLFVAQSVTFETMRKAKDYAAGQVDVELLSAQFVEDRSKIPNWFQKTPDLTRSVQEFGEFQEYRKLPLLKDIIDRLYDATNADWLIYTNVDIALMPYFYVVVDSLLEKGYDAFVVNRRTIDSEFIDLSMISLMYAIIGQPHPGYDCFVFNRKVYPNYRLNNICIGVNWVGQALLWNLICFSSKFREFADLHLTFHIGDDRNWKNPAFQDYVNYNESAARDVYHELEARFGRFEENHPMEPYIPLRMNRNRPEIPFPKNSIIERIKRRTGLS